jgi:hypothetical protein
MIFRDNASHGEWCVLLLPIALLVSHLSHDVDVDKFRVVVLVLSVSMSAYSFIFGKEKIKAYFLNSVW